MKMHMVSIWYRGVRHTLFVNLPEGEKPQITPEMLRSVGVRTGDAFGVG